MRISLSFMYLYKIKPRYRQLSPQLINIKESTLWDMG